jgi:hypothetical protein
VRVFQDQYFCPDCLDEETILCHHCGTRLWNDDNYGDSDTPLCRRCYDRYYTNCAHCGELLSLDDTYYEDGDDDLLPLCYSCFSALDQPAIHPYSHKPTPVFFGEGTRFFGVELEIDGAGENDDNAKRVLERANGNRERIYCKRDGSLDEGFEIVTHPMTPEYHLTRMPWRLILQEAVSMGYRSHQANTCGLHVHVNRTAFGDTEEDQDACIARILYFFEKHWEELLKFSRRTPRQLERWAARYGYKDRPMDILDEAKKHCLGRYTCVNLTNRNTIEFRIFRGTLKYNTLLATLELVDRICDVALCLSDEDLKAMSWTTFVSGCQAPALVQYLKERRLYVNEPVCGEEEV